MGRHCVQDSFREIPSYQATIPSPGGGLTPKVHMVSGPAEFKDTVHDFVVHQHMGPLFLGKSSSLTKGLGSKNLAVTPGKGVIFKKPV